MKKSLIALTSLALAFPLGIALVFSLQSIARANFNQIHRSTGGGRDRVVVPNQTPGQRVQIETMTTSPRTLTLNACGWGRFQKSGSVAAIANILVNGQQSTGFVPNATVPTCVNGVPNVNHPVGYVVQEGDLFYVRGGTGVGSTVITVSYLRSVGVKANGCGFASFRITPSRPLTEFEYWGGGGLGNLFQLSTLPTTNSVGLVCRKTGLTYTTYAPASGF